MENEICLPDGFAKVADVAQYGAADWSGLIGVYRGVSLSQAFEIADANPFVTFFFYTKELPLLLGDGDGGYRVFNAGDAAFFRGEPCWGEAEGHSDGYLKLD